MTRVADRLNVAFIMISIPYSGYRFQRLNLKGKRRDPFNNALNRAKPERLH